VELEEELSDSKQLSMQHATASLASSKRVEQMQTEMAAADFRNHEAETTHANSISYVEHMRQVQRLQAEVHESRTENDIVRRDAEDAMRRQSELHNELCIQWQERLKQVEKCVPDANNAVQDVEGSDNAGGLLPLQRRTPPSVRFSIDNHRNSVPPELVPEKHPLGKLHMWDSDAFVSKLQKTCHGIAEAVTRASGLHAASVKERVAFTKGAHTDDLNRHELERQRQLIISNFKEAMHELRAAWREAATQQLSGKNIKKIERRITFETKRCELELSLLHQNSGSFCDIPPNLMRMLADISDTGLQNKVWDSGLTPMHLAAQTGRRDVLEYLIRQPGGLPLLLMPDCYGKTPLQYAHSKQNTVLSAWLREEVGVNAPLIQVLAHRPNVDQLSPQYLMVLEQVEAQGWQTVNWKDGFTMLHWSAEKDNGTLCRYLVKLQGDPHAQDKHGRTPIDCALGNGNTHTVKVFKEIDEMLKTEAITLSPVSPTDEHSSYSDSGSNDGGELSEPESEDSIPHAFQDIIAQVDELGWDNFNWEHGFTLLHWAGKFGHPNLVLRFIKRRANPNHRDDSGKTAIDYARENNHMDTLRNLLK